MIHPNHFLPQLLQQIQLVQILGNRRERKRRGKLKCRERKYTIRVYPKMWAPIAGKIGASAAENEKRQDRKVTKRKRSEVEMTALMYVTCPHPELSKAHHMRAHPWRCTTVGRHRTSQLFQRETPRRWADLGKDFVTNDREACRGGPARTLHLSKTL